MKVTFELNEGIASGCTKRLLEQYNTGIVFTQRKSYDEYYSRTEKRSRYNARSFITD